MSVSTVLYSVNVLSQGGIYMFAIVMCIILLMCTLTICGSMLCVLMVEGMSVVVNVMLFMMIVMSPPPALCDLSVRTVVKLCTFQMFDLGVSWVS